VPNGERAERTSDRVLYRIDVFHGLVPQPEHVSADERRLYQSDAVLLGALHQWPLRRDELRHDERAVPDDVELLLVSVHQRQVPVAIVQVAHGQTGASHEPVMVPEVRL
jgi:hypothetical protein